MSDEAAVPAVATARAPSLGRRLACMVYEAMLLFGLSLVPAVLGAIFVAQTGKASAWQSDSVLRLFALVVYGIYFVWFWSRRGQTLAMQTWRIRLERADGTRLGQGRALVRYAVCCLGWFGPAMFAIAALHPRPWPSLGLFAVGVVLWALLALAAPGRQFWHDRICGTCLVDTRAEPAPGRPVRPRPR